MSIRILSLESAEFSPNPNPKNRFAMKLVLTLICSQKKFDVSTIEANGKTVSATKKGKKITVNDSYTADSRRRGFLELTANISSTLHYVKVKVGDNTFSAQDIIDPDQIPELMKKVKVNIPQK